MDLDAAFSSVTLDSCMSPNKKEGSTFIDLSTLDSCMSPDKKEGRTFIDLSTDSPSSRGKQVADSRLKIVPIMHTYWFMMFL